jgi:hypothetical protein
MFCIISKMLSDWLPLSGVDSSCVAPLPAELLLLLEGVTGIEGIDSTETPSSWTPGPAADGILPTRVPLDDS